MLKITDSIRSRRSILHAASIAAAALILPTPAKSDSTRGLVKLIVGHPPGGSADAVARATSVGLTNALQQSVVVENRPGGQLAISVQALTTAPPDGRTLMYLHNGYLAMQASQKQFDIENQTSPIIATIKTPIVILVRGDSRFSSLQSLFSYAQGNPGKLTYSTFGHGSIEHLKMAQIERAAGFKGLAVPYKGGPDAVRALMSGEVDVMIGPAIFSKNFSTKLKTLAILEKERWNELPDVPTFAETGVQVPPLAYWGGWVAPAGTAPNVVTQLFEALTAATQSKNVVEQLHATAHESKLSSSSEDFKALIRDDLRWMREAAKANGIAG